MEACGEGEPDHKQSAAARASVHHLKIFSYFIKCLLYLLIVCECTYVYVSVMALMWTSEDNLQESFLILQPCSTMIKAQEDRLGIMFLDSLSHPPHRPPSYLLLMLNSMHISFSTKYFPFIVSFFFLLRNYQDHSKLSFQTINSSFIITKALWYRNYSMLWELWHAHTAQHYIQLSVNSLASLLVLPVLSFLRFFSRILCFLAYWII